MAQVERLIVNGHTGEIHPASPELSKEDREQFGHEYQKVGRLILQKKERLTGLVQQTIHGDDESRLGLQQEITDTAQELVKLCETLGRIAEILNDPRPDSQSES